MLSTEIAIRDDRRPATSSLAKPANCASKARRSWPGYWNRPDETAKVMTADGSLRTGDMARVDKRGFVYIVDRKKDMINVSGFNVYP